MSKDETMIYAVRHGKLVNLLQSPDYLVTDHWRSKEEVQVLEQRSTFLAFPDGSLEETRSTTLDGRPSQVERRIWHPGGGIGRFTPGPFRPATSR